MIDEHPRVTSAVKLSADPRLQLTAPSEEDRGRWRTGLQCGRLPLTQMLQGDLDTLLDEDL